MKNKSIALKLNGLTVNELLKSDFLLDEVAAAFCLNCSVATLQRDRHINGTQPNVPYIKRGRSVRYEPEVLKTVIERSRIGHIA
jgi:hypothetical protein